MKQRNKVTLQWKSEEQIDKYHKKSMEREERFEKQITQITIKIT